MICTRKYDMTLQQCTYSYINNYVVIIKWKRKFYNFDPSNCRKKHVYKAGQQDPQNVLFASLKEHMKLKSLPNN
jgi:phage terminase large subunit